MIITLDQFIPKWAGKHVDFDGIYPDQCMDLMHQYVYDVCGITDITVLAAPVARLVYRSFKWQHYFMQFPNTPTGFPSKGDIIFWDGIKINGDPNNITAGHVAIVVDANVNDLHSFDANYPVGSLPHIQYHTYDNVLGWLRPLPNATPPTPDYTVKQLTILLQKAVSERRWE